MSRLIMAVKQWLIGSGLVCLGIVFIVMGAVTPIIVNSSLTSRAKSDSVLKKSNHESRWGSIPGQLDQVIFQTFNFYNIENPDQVLWQGAVPLITEKNGYVYQEFDTFEDVEYSHGSVQFFNYKRLVKTDNCIWSNSTSPNDQITTINPGSFAVWNDFKHLPRERLALYSLYEVLNVFNEGLAEELYVYSMFPNLDTLDLAQANIFTPAGIDPTQGAFIYNDPYFGLGDKSTMGIWVKILIENVASNQFVMPMNITGQLYTFQIAFALSPQQIEQLFSGQLLKFYISAVSTVYSAYSVGDYKCGRINNMNMCDPQYLGALQWATSTVTTNPPNITPFGPSIVDVKTYITGYPEVNYYIKSTPIGNKYPGVSFAVSDYFSLFNVSPEGWPVYSESSLMDVGRMQNFFSLAYSGNFSDIAQQFNLTDETTARVLWDYINGLVDGTALQGRSDPSVYNNLNRGISSEYGMGIVGSETLRGIMSQFASQMPLAVTGVYSYLRAVYNLNLTCEIVVGDILPEAEYICFIEALAWQNDTTGFQQWVGVHWYGLNSIYAYNFMNVSGLTNDQMQSLFGETSPLTGNLSIFDNEIMEHYECENAGSRCSDMFLAEMQWGQGYVSRNLPSIFSLFSITNSSTVCNITQLYLGTDTIVEYYYYAVVNKSEELSYNQTRGLLGSNGLYIPQIFQRYFIYIYELNSTAIEDEFNITSSFLLASYLRSMVNTYYFGGMIATKTVNELLFANNDPLISKFMTKNPLEGGNPALSQQLGRFAQNQTREQWEYIDPSMKTTINSGKSDISKVRKYDSYLGATYANYLKLEYLGEGPRGPNLVMTNANPWANKIPIEGVDGLFFRPSLSKDDSLSYYYEPGCITMKLSYNKTVNHKGLECYRYMMKASQFQNISQNPAQANYWQFGPPGILNLTTIFSVPFFLSSPYFLDADPTLNNLIQYTTLQFDVPERYHSYYDLEKFTGTPISQFQQFQINAELRQDALFPNLGATNRILTGYNTYLPIVYIQRSSLMTRDTVQNHFDYIISGLQAAEAVFILGILVGIMLIIAAALFWLKVTIIKQRVKKGEIMISSKQPMLLA